MNILILLYFVYIVLLYLKETIIFYILIQFEIICDVLILFHYWGSQCYAKSAKNVCINRRK